MGTCKGLVESAQNTVYCAAWNDRLEAFHSSQPALSTLQQASTCRTVNIAAPAVGRAALPAIFSLRSPRDPSPKA
jgi:hypothetical protein